MQQTYGYIRVSSTDQNEGRQRMALEQQAIPANCIFMDKLSGSCRGIRLYLTEEKKICTPE